MPQTPCHQLRDAGTAVWLDQLSRDLVESGTLAELIQGAALTGMTSNPAIFHAAMTKGTAYDAQLVELAGRGLTPEATYEELAVRDIQMCCDTLRPVWEETRGKDGYVSLEVSPHLARDTKGTTAAAHRLHAWVARPNLLIKIPGTPEGIPAIEECLAGGIPINVTLLFSIEAYEAVARAYIRALERRQREGKPLQVASVASFFVSRIDSLTDSRLEAAAAAHPTEKDALLALRGKTAVANARLAYQSFQRIFGSDAFRALAAKGAWVQRPLWASTSTKNPSYPATLYVDTLVGPDSVNTMPMETLVAVQERGKIVPNTVLADVEGARRLFAALEAAGISFRGVTDQLLVEAIDKFNDPYDKLLGALEAKMAAQGRAR